MASFDRITSDPAILNGQPCVRGMRLRISMIESSNWTRRNQVLA